MRTALDRNSAVNTSTTVTAHARSALHDVKTGLPALLSGGNEHIPLVDNHIPWQSSSQVLFLHLQRSLYPSD